MPTDTFSLSQTVRTYPSLPYRKMKDDILGASYALSLVFVGAQRARALNRIHRQQKYTPNVLSFALDDTHGEIFMTPAVIAAEAKQRHVSTTDYAGFLFIHGLLHLKGMRHGDTMEEFEKKYCRRYNLV